MIFKNSLKRDARRQRKLDKINAATVSALNDLAGILGRAVNLTHNQIVASCKHGRSHNFGGRVLWDSSKHGTYRFNEHGPLS